MGLQTETGNIGAGLHCIYTYATIYKRKSKPLNETEFVLKGAKQIQ